MSKLVAHVQSVLDRKGHCVVCVAEGAGQVRARGGRSRRRLRPLRACSSGTG